MKFKLETLVGLLIFYFLFGIGLCSIGGPVFIKFAGDRFGVLGGLIAGILTLLFFFFVFMRGFYQASDVLEKRGRAEAREKYRGIYRVLSLPTKSRKPNNWCAEEITIGDFGWESTPLTKDGLIWLQGLTTEWKMAWRAGFKPEEIEFVCFKPVSQYDWKDFEYDGPKPKSIWTTAIPKQPCPFSIKKTPKYSQLQFPI